MRASDADTIVALATAAGAAGLAVVRLSGPAALEIGDRMFASSAGGASRGAPDTGAGPSAAPRTLRDSDSHRAHHGWVHDTDGERIDEVLALVLRRPHGYTGEDTVEFSCHGSPQAVDEVVATALACGARLAEPGEFTRRAFLNGRLDLTQAEAVADLIAAPSRAARRAALEQLRGRLRARLQPLRGALVDLLGEIEASIDFVEEDVEFFDRAAARDRGASARDEVQSLLDTAGDGEVLRAGIVVSLAGIPNAGKSRLFNAILRSPRSIVTEHAGTTRDVVRETIRLGGIAFVLEDTAGLRESSADPVEAIGIERSRASHAAADVVLFVVDASRPRTEEERAALAALEPERAVVALSQIDRLEAAAAAVQPPPEVPAGVPCVPVSAATGAGIDALLDALLQQTRARRLALQNDALVTINARHREVLLRAHAALERFDAEVAGAQPPEILAADLREAVAALGEVTGEQVTEEILDAIFSRFCIGK